MSSRRFSASKTTLAACAVFAMILSGWQTSAQAQYRLKVYVPSQMISHPEFSYPVVVQLQDAAGQPVRAPTKMTITLRSSNPNVVRAVTAAHLLPTLNPPSGDFKGNTFGSGQIAAAQVNAVGGATIYASAPGFAEASAVVNEMITLPKGNEKWPPPRTVSLTLMPPVIGAGESPVGILEPRDQSGRLTADPSGTTGAGNASYQIESSNPSVVARGPVLQLSAHYYGGKYSGNLARALAAGQTNLTLRLIDRSNITGGSAPLTVVSAEPVRDQIISGRSEQEQPPIIIGQPKLADITKDIVINPGAVWEGDLPASRTLSLLARLQYAIVAGANRVFEISVNGQRLAGALLNKSPQFTIGDGRTITYFDGSVWAVFYSPDFNTNNTPAAGVYQVVTNPGEAYRYQWDVSALVGSGATMHVRIVNTNKANSAPIIVHFTP